MKWQECEDNYIMGKYIIYTHYQLVSVWSSQRKVDEQGSGIFGHLCEDMKIILNEMLKNWSETVWTGLIWLNTETIGGLH